MSIKFKRPFVPSDWLNLTPQNGESLSGELYDSESDQFYIEVNSENLLEGFYNASIIISSSGISDLEIPISLNVLSDIGLLGDLNGDLSINIQDVVLLVGTILGSGDFVENGDLNQDGFNDVVDIVTLVNIILDS